MMNQGEAPRLNNHPSNRQRQRVLTTQDNAHVETARQSQATRAAIKQTAQNALTWFLGDL